MTKQLSIADDLKGEFLRVIGDGHFQRVDTIGEAHGVKFLCPKCFAANNGPVGTHAVICWSRSARAPDDQHPLPGRWTLHGNGLHDLTLHGDPLGGARSVLLTAGCGWHGFVDAGFANGDIP